MSHLKLLYLSAIITLLIFTFGSSYVLASSTDYQPAHAPLSDYLLNQSTSYSPTTPSPSSNSTNAVTPLPQSYQSPTGNQPTTDSETERAQIPQPVTGILSLPATSSRPQTTPQSAMSILEQRQQQGSTQSSNSSTPSSIVSSDASAESRSVSDDFPVFHWITDFLKSFNYLLKEKF